MNGGSQLMIVIQIKLRNATRLTLPRNSYDFNTQQIAIYNASEMTCVVI